jgi:hypothetical protein
MSKKQEGLCGAAAVIPDNEILEAGVGSVYMNVLLRETGLSQPLRHRLGRSRDVLRRIGCIDLDQLPVNVAGQALCIGDFFCMRKESREQEKYQCFHFRS